jgi:diacylglycerol kinase (ATP)
VKELLQTACPRERIGILFNPVSGTSDPVARRASLEALARDAGLECELIETDADRGAGPLAQQAVADGLQRLIVAGGDGSVTEAAHALVGTETSLAVVPGGTGNLLALNLGIPTDPEAAMELALTGEDRHLDVGRANGAVFLVAAGMGLDARTMRDADRALKDRFGKLAYFIAGWRNLRRRNQLFTITIDGQQMHRYGQTVLIANVGQIAAGLELVPDSDPEDGLLDIAILRTRRMRELGILALRAGLRRSRSDDLLEIHHGRHIVVEARPPQPVQIDGDEIGAISRLDAVVEPGGLRLVRPSAADPPPFPDLIAETANRRPWLIPAGLAVLSAIAAFVYRRRSRVSR